MKTKTELEYTMCESHEIGAPTCESTSVYELCIVFTLVRYVINTHFIFQIVVPVYELLGSGPDEGIHWYTLCINLKAQRFEALDSIRQKSNPVYVANATTLMNRIKEAWKLYYYKSRVQIEDYKLEIIGVQNIGAQ